MLEIRNVFKTFFAGTANEVRALQGVDLTIEQGAFVVVIGTNGSGKSTLLNAVAGTFPVDAGTIRLAGRDVTRWPEHRRARLIGRVFQNPFSGTAPSMTIAENLALAAKRGRVRGVGWALSGTRRRELRERVRGMGLGLEDRLSNPIGTLSGGQRQSLTLLMAGLIKPELLLLDEIRLTEAMIKRDQLTTLMVTHSMQQAAHLGDRLVMMDRGRVIHDFKGVEKRRLRPEDLLARFEDVRRANQLDETAAEMLRSSYV
jgi:putative ABC transport system ATP-binding protein